MKNTLPDLVAAGGLLTALVVASVLIVAALHPLLSLLGPYHGVVGALLFLAGFSGWAAVAARLIRRWRPVAPGSYAMDSKPMFWWKLHTVAVEFGCTQLLPLVPIFLRPVFYSAFGTRIGANVEIAGKLVELPLVALGDHAFVGGQAFITAHAITHDAVRLAPVTIGERATIGVQTVIMPGVVVGHDAVVAPNSLVLMGTEIPPGEFWGGSPARAIQRPRSSTLAGGPDTTAAT